MKETKKARFNQFYFPSQYSDPMHEDKKRLEQITFQNFDPYTPENRQVVANCKKHRSQKHELSDKCKAVLSIIDVQERLLSVKTPNLYGQPDTPAIQADILIKFGDGIPKVSKDFIKYWIASSGIIKEPYSREYDVHTTEDAHIHSDRFTLILRVPFFESEIIPQDKMKQITDAFMENPEAFAEKFPVKSVVLYGKNKITGEDDAFGVNIEGHPRTIATVEGKKVEPINKAVDYSISPEDAYANMSASEQRRMAEAQRHYLNQTERAKALKRKLDEQEEMAGKIQDAQAKKEKDFKSNKQKEILNRVLDPGRNIAPSQVSVQGGWTNPIDDALRALASAGKVIGNVADDWERHNKRKQAIRASQAEAESKMRKLMEDYATTHEKLDRTEAEASQDYQIASNIEEKTFTESSGRLREKLYNADDADKKKYAQIEEQAKKEKAKQEKQQQEQQQLPETKPESTDYEEEYAKEPITLPEQASQRPQPKQEGTEPITLPQNKPQQNIFTVNREEPIQPPKPEKKAPTQTAQTEQV